LELERHRPSEDAIVCHYAVKAIENAATIRGEHTVAMATNEMVLLLWAVHVQQNDPNIRKSCGWAISRLVEQNQALFQHLLDKVGVVPVLDTLRDTSRRVRQAFLNAMLHSLGGSSSGADDEGGRGALLLSRLQLRMLDTPDLVGRIEEAMDGASSVIRAKCYLLLAVLGELNPGLLAQALKPKIMAVLERDARRGHDPDEAGETYLFECGGWFIQLVVKAVPRLIAPLCEVLKAVSGRKR
jgi:hypothetical protein